MGRLTPRQGEVVAGYVACGSSKAAAYRVGMSERTVEHHLAATRIRLGVETSMQAIYVLAARASCASRWARAGRRANVRTRTLVAGAERRRRRSA